MNQRSPSFSVNNPLLLRTCDRCGEDGYNCRCDQFYPTSAKMLKLDTNECKDLIHFIFDMGYISHEFHPNIHKITKKIQEFLNGKRTS